MNKLKLLIQSNNFKLSILCTLLIFISVSLFFAPVVFQGKIIQQQDVILAQGMQQNLHEYTKAHNGEDALWSISMFSGMPAYTIYFKSPGLIVPIFDFLSLGLGQPVGIIFWGMLSFFFLMRHWNVGHWLALGGAFAFGFYSYYIIITEAGHLNKHLAILFFPLTVWGLSVTYQGKFLAGGTLFVLAMGLEFCANHIQMTYYLILILFLYAVNQLYLAVVHKTLSRFAIASGIILLGGIVSFGLCANRILPLYEYTEYSIRGKSELQREPSDDPTKQVKNTGSGLDKTYAYAWSNGRDELLTLLIPNLKGGASGIDPTNEKLETIKYARSNDLQQIDPTGQIYNKLTMYWGDQSFTSGPTYAGAIVCFLFIAGLFLVSGGIKWVLLYSTLIFILLSLGGNSFSLIQGLFILFIPVIIYFGSNYLSSKIKKETFGTIVSILTILILSFSDLPEQGIMTFKDFFFDYIPLYNKFRTPASILAAAGLTIPLLAFLGGAALLDSNRDSKERLTALYYSAGITGFLCLALWLMPNAFFSSFASARELEPGYFTPQENGIFNALQQDRENLLRSDALRSFFFILLGAGLIYAGIKGLIKNVVWVGFGIALLVIIDLFSVGKRYLTSENFKSKQEFAQNFTPREADQFLKEKDKSYFRILPYSRNPFNDGKTPYHLNTLGGYNAAKIKRYQQLIEAHIQAVNPNVLNMLNMKYFIFNREIAFPGFTPIYKAQSDGEVVYQNTEVYGHAWITPNVLIVKTPDEALDTLDGINSKNVAIVEHKDANLLKPFSTDSLNSAEENITLEHFDNRYIQYKFNSPKTRFVTFSEVFYSGTSKVSQILGRDNSSLGWRATIDGKEVPIVRTNFILRGIVVPKGAHKIEFKYNPDVMEVTNTITYISSAILLLSFVVLLFVSIKKLKDDE